MINMSIYYNIYEPKYLISHIKFLKYIYNHIFLVKTYIYEKMMKDNFKKKLGLI